MDDKTRIQLVNSDDLFEKEFTVSYDISTSELTATLYLVLFGETKPRLSHEMNITGSYNSSQTISFVRANETSFSPESNELSLSDDLLDGASSIYLYVTFSYPYKYEGIRTLSFYESCDYIWPVTLTYPTEQLTISFTNETDTTGNPGNPIVIGATGVLELEPAAPEVGDDITVRVIDADLNVNAAVAESFSVQASSDKGENETLVLTETGVNTGIFVGLVSTTSGTSAGTDNDGVFNAEDNTEISVSYDDQLDANGNNPAPITKTVRLREPPPSLTFADFLNKDVILDSTVTYNGTTINPANIASVTKALSLYLPDATSGCTQMPAPLPGQCYGFEYEHINGTSNEFDVYYNTDFNYCNCATDATPAFSNAFTYSGNIVRINSGLGFEDWTLTIVDNNHFRLHIISGGGSQVSERHYSVK